jgi:predicted nucleotidyltransferase
MPTALELTREEWQPYIDAARQRAAPPEPTLVEQRERKQLMARVREVSSALKARFGVRRVIVFGSLANAEWFTPDSDIDLAVEGLAVNDFWEAWRLAEEIIADRPVDLIEIEMAKESLLQAIQRYGIEL